MSNALISTAAKAASLNIVYQAASRVITFALNAYILRYVTKDVLGVINVRLILLYSTVQFISRESFRRISTSESKSHKWSDIVNLLWLSLPLSIVLGALFSTIWLKALYVPDPNQIPGYEFAVGAIYCSVIIEMMAEPFWVFGQLNGYIKLRIIAEAGGLLLRCSLMALFIRNNSKNALYIFGIAQILSALSYILCYWIYFKKDCQRLKKVKGSSVKSLNDFLPDFHSKKIVNQKLIILSWTFIKQTFVKQLLSEGEKFVMTFFNPLTFSEQGVYDLVHNLASLAARFIFQPIEESSYIVFSQLIEREKKPEGQDKQKLKISKDMLRNILKLMLILGLTIVSFGYSYSYLALLLYAGFEFAQGIGTLLLKWQCFYTLIIAINGILECFTFAAMNKKQLDGFNKTLVYLSGLFLSSAYFLTLFVGSEGFIIANCVNMIGRIVFSLSFIRNYFDAAKINYSVKEFLLNPPLLAIFGLAFLSLKLSESFLCCDSTLEILYHLGIGFCWFIIVTASIYLQERGLILYLLKPKAE